MDLARAGLPAQPYRHLIEEETLAAIACRRRVLARVEEGRLPAEVRSVLEHLLGQEAPAWQAALAVALGYEFDPRRLTVDEVLRRLVGTVVLQALGAATVLASPVSYAGRSRWDLYAPDRRLLLAVNRMVRESDVLTQVRETPQLTVLWGPWSSPPRQPGVWYLLEYRLTGGAATAGPDRFDETVQQLAQESRSRRQARLDLTGGAALVGEFEAVLADLRQALAAAITLAA